MKSELTDRDKLMARAGCLFGQMAATLMLEADQCGEDRQLILDVRESLMLEADQCGEDRQLILDVCELVFDGFERQCQDVTERN